MMPVLCPGRQGGPIPRLAILDRHWHHLIIRLVSQSQTSSRKSISQTFASLRKRDQIALMPFIPAGYPDLATTAAILPELEKAGAALIEVGIPFSDPIADGPTIQAAFTYALAKKIRVKDVLRMFAEARRTMTIPMVAMLSYSIIFRYGDDRFFSELHAAGVDGVIIPDLPPPEARSVCGKVRAAGLETILLVAPTTSAQRRKEIADLCSGFVYYMSLSGITGERAQLPADVTGNVRELKAMTSTPVCVGFGISRPQHVAQLRQTADGAIVGSAFVRKITQHINEPPDRIAQAISAYCRELLS